MTTVSTPTDSGVVRSDDTLHVGTAEYHGRHCAEDDRPPLVRFRTADYQPRHAAPDTTGGEA